MRWILALLLAVPAFADTKVGIPVNDGSVAMYLPSRNVWHYFWLANPYERKTEVVLVIQSVLSPQDQDLDYNSEPLTWLVEVDASGETFKGAKACVSPTVVGLLENEDAGCDNDSKGQEGESNEGAHD